MAYSSTGKSGQNDRSGLSIMIKVLVCACVVVPVFVLLQNQLADMDKTQIAQAFRDISVEALLLSGLFTGVSLFAVARYDALALRQLGHSVPDGLANQAGFAAVSLGQTLGLGLLVGSVVRWRFYRHLNLSITDAGLVSALVAGGFLLGFAIVFSVSALVNPAGLSTMIGASSGQVTAFAVLCLAASGVIVGLSVTQARLRVGRFTLATPRFQVLRAQILLAALDVIPAAMALWVLMPAEAGPSLALVVPVYLSALGLGLVSNTPGGLGVLELACLMALPVMPPEHLVAALIAYRGIYYGIPAVLAVGMLLAREWSARDTSTAPQGGAAPVAVPDVDAALSTSTRAEAQLALLGDKSFVFSDCGQGFIMYAQSGNSLLALGDPVAPDHLWPELVARFVQEAMSRMVYPAFYKAGPEFAELLAAQGLYRAQISVEAVVDVAGYGTGGSSKRELRRKINTAEKAGVSIRQHAAGQAPLQGFARTNARWAAQKGGERGFSMGYFAPDYLKNFTVLEAVVDGQCVGFLSLWSSGDGSEHGLDVMRVLDNAPDGTMHALVNAGIMRAKDAGAARFSLCAVPLAGIETPCNAVEQLVSWIYTKKTNWHASTGLYRFKNAFRPDWEPRYGVARNPLALLMAARDTAELVRPIKAAPQPDATAEDCPLRAAA